AAYVFRFDPEASAWIEQTQLFPQPNAWTNFFGWSVAIDGETTVIGADGEDQQRGAAYVFDVALNCDCPHDLDGNGSVGASDLLSLLVSWGPCKGCPADFDDNGTVGASDLLALLVSWGPCKGCPADFDDNGTVGASDLLALLVNWGPCP
ncbi:MAG: FG-GAP repeat protein, partial [Phycisphaerales bacterium]